MEQLSRKLQYTVWTKVGPVGKAMLPAEDQVNSLFKVTEATQICTDLLGQPLDYSLDGEFFFNLIIYRKLSLFSAFQLLSYSGIGGRDFDSSSGVFEKVQSICFCEICVYT
jgi:hypothetical protein